MKRPFSIFTAEDFALEVDGPYELTKAERQAVADRANAILNERGTRVYGDTCCPIYSTEKSNLDKAEALLLGQRSIEK